MSDPGSWLRERRQELHLTRSGVERVTSGSAREAANERYRIRRGRLTDLEAGRSAPDIFEVASLCNCYKVTYPAVLQAFGMKLGESGSMSQGPISSDETAEQWSLTGTGRLFSPNLPTNISFDPIRRLRWETGKVSGKGRSISCGMKMALVAPGATWRGRSCSSCPIRLRASQS